MEGNQNASVLTVVHNDNTVLTKHDCLFGAWLCFYVVICPRLSI